MTTTSGLGTTTTSTTTAAQESATTANSAASLASNYTNFITLLTTQLQNQDPLNPMDSSQFTSQLVAFSSVEQQIDTNQKLDDMLALQSNTAAQVGLSYIGKDISYDSSEMNWDGKTPVTITYALASAASSATLNISDADGNIIKSQTVSGATGQQTVTWDGTNTDGTTMAAGTYSLSLVATDSTGTAVTSATAVTGTVRGIETQNSSLYLLVGDRAVPLTSVIQATDPDSTTAASGGTEIDTSGNTSS